MGLDTNTRPAASVIVPVYNKEHFIAETIESVLQQTWIDFELILIDDGSTDNSRQIIQAYDDPRIRYIYQENKGRSAARNTGIRESEGNYITFLDADDTFLPNKLLVQISYLERHPEFGMVVGRPIRTDEDGKILFPYPPITQEFSLADMLISPRFPIHAPLIRRCWIEQAGFFDETLHAGEDYEYFCQMALAGCRIFRNDDFVCVYRYVPETMSNKPDQQTQGILRVIEKLFSHPNLPHHLVHLKEKSLSNAHLQGAYRYFASGPAEKCVEHILEAVKFDPELRTNHYQTFIARFLDKLTHLDAYDFVSYFDVLTSQLPEDIQQAYRLQRTDLLQHIAKAKKIDITHLENAAPSTDISEIPAVGTADRPILFLPSNDTHVKWMTPIAQQLEYPQFMVLGVGYENADYFLQQLGKNYSVYHQGTLKNMQPAVIVLGNDWGHLERSVLKEAKSLGIPSVVIQEGVLDFLDQKYRRLMTADYVFLQGTKMLEYVKRGNLTVTGNPKYDALEAIPLPEEPSVLINCNFTYGVFEEVRYRWIDDIVKTCRQLGLEFKISLHPRDQGVFPDDYNVIQSNAFKLEEQLANASILISRFSTVIYEALIMGRDVIYYNPHNEPFRIFSQDDTGGVNIANKRQQLLDDLENHVKNPGGNTENRKKLLELHCNLDGQNAAIRCAETLKKIAEKHKPAPIVAKANYLLAQNDIKGARNLIQEALDKNPDSALLITTMGKILFEFGALDRARREFIKAAEKDPEYADAHFNLAVVFMKMGETEKASASAHRVLEITPGDPSARAILSQ